jgi:hypothetical protein
VVVATEPTFVNPIATAIRKQTATAAKAAVSFPRRED